MSDEKLKTDFAPSERTTESELTRQTKLFHNKGDLITMANAMEKMVVILNKERQIIYANDLFLETTGVTDINSIIGKRPGEAISCLHASQTDGGCGTTEFCKTCGAINAILEAQKGKEATKECRISTINNDALDIRVSTTPYKLNKENFTIFAISDISDEKRKIMLERVFFHDVLNSAGGISGLSSIMKEINDPVELAELSQMINRASDNLIEELQSQRQLSAAERGDLQLRISQGGSLDILKQLGETYARHEVIGDKRISILPDAENVQVETDLVLLRRILANMIKNAIEASAPTATVTLSCMQKDKEVVFSIHNTTFMPRDIQLQMFKRSFSTKGVGRGIGTYSMKLFGEKYLKGKVWFESKEESGTTFYLEI